MTVRCKPLFISAFINVMLTLFCTFPFTHWPHLARGITFDKFIVGKFNCIVVSTIKTFSCTTAFTDANYTSIPFNHSQLIIFRPKFGTYEMPWHINQKAGCYRYGQSYPSRKRLQVIVTYLNTLSIANTSRICRGILGSPG